MCGADPRLGQRAQLDLPPGLEGQSPTPRQWARDRGPQLVEADGPGRVVERPGEPLQLDAEATASRGRDGMLTDVPVDVVRAQARLAGRHPLPVAEVRGDPIEIAHRRRPELQADGPVLHRSSWCFRVGTRRHYGRPASWAHRAAGPAPEAPGRVA